MKINSAITIRTATVPMIILCFASFLNPANSATIANKMNIGIKVEKQILSDNAISVLPAEIFFKY